jgi:hypothetical protein
MLERSEEGARKGMGDGVVQEWYKTREMECWARSIYPGAFGRQSSLFPYFCTVHDSNGMTNFTVSCKTDLSLSIASVCPE